MVSPGGEGGGGYSHTLPLRVYATQRGLDFLKVVRLVFWSGVVGPERGRDFEHPDLEWGIHFRDVV